MTNLMTSSLSDWLAILWRRRRALIIPFLCFTVLGVLAAFLMPRSYVARSLFMLQEAEQGPLMRNSGTERTNDDLADRILGLQTLLKSDRVLTAIAVELNDGNLPEDPKMRETMLRNIKDTITLQQISAQFIELRLKSSEPVGLGRQLETVMAILFENLIAPERNVQTASRLVVDRRERQLTDAETRLSAFVERNPDIVARAALEDAPAVCADMSRSASSPGAARSAADSNPACVKAMGPAIGTVSSGAAEPSGSLAYRRLTSGVSRARAAQSFIGKRIGPVGNESMLGILRAPERVLIIDAPRDPQFPVIGRAVIVLIGVLSGLLLGLGLALVLELFDQRIRTTKQLENLIPAPMIARLPFMG